MALSEYLDVTRQNENAKNIYCGNDTSFNVMQNYKSATVFCALWCWSSPVSTIGNGKGPITCVIYWIVHKFVLIGLSVQLVKIC